MGAKFVAAIIGVIILVVLAQTFIFGGDDGAPSVTNPGSIPTATPPVEQSPPVLLGEGQGGGSSGGGGGSSAGTLTTYTVQEGQFLGSIATELGIPPEEQAAWIQEVLDLNGMEDPRQLQAGQELILPARSQAPSSQSSSDSADDGEPETQATAPPSATGTLPTATPGTGAGGGGGTYVVVDGDYPYLIALKHCVDDPDAWVNDLLSINGVDASSLAIGLELDLPAGTPPFCGETGGGEDASPDDEASDEEDGNGA